MLDIENLVKDKLITALATSWSTATVGSGYDEESAKYPYVGVEQIDSVPVRRTMTEPNSENHTTVSFEINVYSNKQDTARSECISLLNAVDDAMQEMGFYRYHTNKPLKRTRTVWRRYARYRAIVEAPIEDSQGNLVYHIYRR